MNVITQPYKVGTCPACQHNIVADAVIETEGAEGAMPSPPDPRQEGAVTLKGKITGAQVRAHDCRKKVTR